jgi:hypothetical protein
MSVSVALGEDEDDLVKSLHSGDPNGIQTYGLVSAYYLGVNDLQVLFSLHPREVHEHMH